VLVLEVDLLEHQPLRRRRELLDRGADRGVIAGVREQTQARAQLDQEPRDVLNVEPTLVGADRRLRAPPHRARQDLGHVLLEDVDDASLERIHVRLDPAASRLR
jgi:hypothetical protein